MHSSPPTQSTPPAGLRIDLGLGGLPVGLPHTDKPMLNGAGTDQVIQAGENNNGAATGDHGEPGDFSQTGCGAASTNRIQSTDTTVKGLEIIPIDDGPPLASVAKESWAECYPLCPRCAIKPMSQLKKKWKCKWCGNSNAGGKWCVEYFPTIPTLNKLERLRLNQLTLETWDNQKAAENRVLALQIHFGHIRTLPSQPTSQSPEQCRAAESLLRILKQRNLPFGAAFKTAGQFFDRFCIEDLGLASRLLAAVNDSARTSPEELIKFLAAHKNCGIPCSLLGMVEYCATTKWHGDLVKRPTFVEAIQRVMQHKTANYVGGGRALDPESLSKPKSLNGYIMAHFQPDYPKPTYPEVFTDKAIIEFVTYSYDTPRPGMPPTEMEKWRTVCAEAKAVGQQPPEKPVERQVYKLVEDGMDDNGMLKYKKVAGKLEYPQPWPRGVMNSFIVQCRSLKNAMARKTLCLEPAGWIEPPGPDLKPFHGTREELAAEAKIRAQDRRVLTTAEKQRMLNASLTVDGGCGAASVLWQGWGGGRRADVEHYCKTTLRRVEPRIQLDRWQTKNQSCKDVTPMMNFYLMADFLDQCGLLTDENHQHGFTPMTRIRILIKAGFWEESWGPVVSIAGSRAGADFGYQPFEEDDILDLGNLLKRLRDPAPAPAFAFLWNKFTNHEKEKLSKFREPPGEAEMKYSPLEITRDEVKRIIIARLNEVMGGTNFHTPALFEDVTIRWRTEDLLQLNPTGPNLKYLNRLMLEDLCPEELARRQNYPPNGLRRSGMSAIYQVFEDKNKTIEYFSTGAESWDDSYKSSYTKRGAREHFQVLYDVMDPVYSEEDRKGFLPKGHKLDDFHTPEVIAGEEKNKSLAEKFKQTGQSVVRKPFYNKKKTKYSPEEKAKWVAEFKVSGLTQRKFAEKHNLVFGVFHKWLEIAGETMEARSEEETTAIIEQYKARPIGTTKEEFAGLIKMPFRTFWTLLQKAGLTKEMVVHTPESIAHHIESFKKSGMSRTAFAKSIHVDRVTFLAWLTEASTVTHGNGGARERADAREPVGYRRSGEGVCPGG